MMPNDDSDLRERFAEFRRQDQARAADFNTFLRRRGTAGLLRRFPAWIAVAACLTIAIGVVLGTRRTSRPHPAPEMSITEWRSSTDFLLRTPGQEVLQTVPKFGGWPVEIPRSQSKPPLPAPRKNLTQTFLEEKLS